MPTIVSIENANSPEEKLIFPITPSTVPESGAVDSKSFRLIGRGNFSFPDGRAEQKFKLAGYFPGVRRVNARWDQGDTLSDIVITTTNTGLSVSGQESASLPHIILDVWQPPQKLCGMIKDWLERRTRLRYKADTLTGSINMPCYIAGYSFTRRGGMGDIDYSVDLVEWRTFNVTIDDGSVSPSGNTKSDTSGSESDPAPQDAIPTSYTVKPGDTLSLIAKQFLGDSGRWTEIYDANKDVIGDNPNQIQVGMELAIPGGTVDKPDNDGYDSAGTDATEDTETPS